MSQQQPIRVVVERKKSSSGCGAALLVMVLYVANGTSGRAAAVVFARTAAQGKLRDADVLTQPEFEAKKAERLRRV